MKLTGKSLEFKGFKHETYEESDFVADRYFRDKKADGIDR